MTDRSTPEYFTSSADSYKRTAELYQKKAEHGLDPEEEGEYLGLLSFPDNPEGAALVRREYLARLVQGDMSPADKQRLTELRMAKIDAGERNSEPLPVSGIQRTLKNFIAEIDEQEKN